MRRKFVILIIGTLVMIGWTIYYFYNKNSIFIEIPNPLVFLGYFSVLLNIFFFFGGLYRYFDMKEAQEEYRKHLNYINYILALKNLKLNGAIFSDFNEAEEEYKKYKSGYIIPYGYKYSLLNDNEFNLDEFLNNVKNIDDFEKKADKLDSTIIYKEFIDVKGFIDSLKKNDKKAIKIEKSGYDETLDESFFLNEDDFGKFKKLFKESRRIVVLKGYLFVKYE